jgi:diguanylate cyclase (GGDEF)-like protein/PAS domain S-box-containing protein
MPAALKVLVIEDSADDAELAIATLQRAWQQVEWRRVEDAEQFRAMLSWPPDVIIADYEVPGFGALPALKMLKDIGSDIPLVVFTGAVAEDIVVNCMRYGAADYLLKDRLTRLGPAIENALSARREREAKRHTEREQLRLSALNEALLDSLPAYAALLDSKGHLLAINAAWRGADDMNGFASNQLTLGMHYPNACLKLVARYHQHAVNMARGVRSVLSGIREQFVLEYSSDDATEKRHWFRTVVTRVRNTNFDSGAVIMHIDITERRLADEQLRISANALQHLTEGVVITNAQLQVIGINKAYSAMTGYDQDEVQGMPLWTVITGEDSTHAPTASRALALSGGWRTELSSRRKDGEPFPALFSINPVRNALGDIEHYTAVLTDLSSLRDVERRIEYLAQHDALTGLANRAALETRLLHTISNLQNRFHVAAVLLIELDRFKSINDTLGHRAGDALIRAVAERLGHLKHPADFLARLGGDEFVLLCHETHNMDSIAPYAEQIRQELEKPFIIGARELFITASIGISCYPHDGLDYESLLRAADAAVYLAKQSGRNAVALYSPSEDAAATERFVLQNSLPMALARDELVLEYQPVVDLNTGMVRSVEALLRWKHPQLGLISPTRFIDIAEDTGLILPISDWVLNTACAQLRRWQLQGWRDPHVAVNLSSRQFSRQDLPERIATALDEYDLKPHQLRLELTESMVMGDPASAAELINKLHGMGIEVALDDFGTGYSSLAYLKRFRLGCLKVDRSFVSGSLNSQGDQSIIRAVVALGKTLDMKVVAEGVETLEQANFLRQVGCDDAQGYFYSRPARADHVPELLEEIPQRFRTPTAAHWQQQNVTVPRAS